MSDYFYTTIAIITAIICMAVYLYFSRYKITYLGDDQVHVQNTEQVQGGCPPINIDKLHKAFPESEDFCWFIDKLQDATYRDWLESEWKRIHGENAKLLFVDCDDIPGDGSVTVMMAIVANHVIKQNKENNDGKDQNTES